MDTNVISELRKRKSGKANAGVVAWAEANALVGSYISVISLMEIETGIRLKERHDMTQGVILWKWYESVKKEFRNRIYEFDEVTASLCSKLYIPDPRTDRDSMIAATANQYNLTIITRNKKDFVGMTDKIINPWITQ